MKNLLDESAFKDTLHRIEQLRSDSINHWGKMTVNEMICHISDPLRDILGIRITEPVTTPEMRPNLMVMLMVESDWAVNQPTFPPYLQGEGGGGTPPKGFDTDKKDLIDLVHRFYKTGEGFAFHPHAGLGMMSRNEFGEFLWKHTDHHLRSFGV